MNGTTLTLYLDIGLTNLKVTALVDGTVVYEHGTLFPAGRVYDEAVAAGVDVADGGPVDLKNVSLTDTMFSPSAIGLEQEGIHRMLYSDYVKLRVELRDIRAVNVVISGDIGGQDAIATRLQTELTALFPADVAVQVTVADG